MAAIASGPKQLQLQPPHAALSFVPSQDLNTVSYLKAVEGKHAQGETVQIQNWAVPNRKLRAIVSPQADRNPTPPKHVNRNAVKKLKHISSKGSRPEKSPEQVAKKSGSPKHTGGGSKHKDAKTPKHKNQKIAVGEYMNQINDNEANLISMTSLQEGEEFERDINNIIEIIDGVEKNMCTNKLTNQFKKTQNLSFNRRKLEMTRTILAQTNHQHNFMLSQAQKMAATHSNPNHLQSQRTASIKNAQLASRQSQRDASDENNFGIRIGKKRPMTTRRTGQLAHAQKTRLNQTQSGGFMFNPRKGNADEVSDGLTNDLLTSAVTQTRAHLESHHFNHTQPLKNFQSVARRINDPSILNLAHTNNNSNPSEILSDNTRNPLSYDHADQPRLLNMQSDVDFTSPQVLAGGRIASAKDYRPVGPRGLLKSQYKSQMMARHESPPREPSRLAGNMTIDEGSTRRNSQQRGVVMHVNKYVPHYMRIPQKFDKKHFRMFEYAPEQN